MARADQQATPDKPDDTIKLGPFVRGMNNIDKATALGLDELVNAVNVDIDRHGLLSSRAGYVRVINDPGTHSLFARDDNTAFYVSGTDLKAAVLDSLGNISSSIIYPGEMRLGSPVAYVVVNGKVYFSNDVITGSIRADNTVHPWGVERPRSRPVLAYTSGNLPAGNYLVGVSFLNDEGEEGGMWPTSPITVPVNSAIVVSLPQPVSADVQKIRVYASSQNSEDIFQYHDYPAGTLTATLLSVATTGRVANTILQDVMPPGDILEYFRGKIFSASGKLVSYTEPLRYGLWSQRTNFIPFEEEVTLIKAVTDGIYFGTPNRVWFIHHRPLTGSRYPGTIEDKYSRWQAAPFGAVKGTGITFPKTEEGTVTVGWYSERGFVKGHDSGKISIGEKERISIGMYARGAALYREKDGLRQVVGAMRNPTREGFTSTDYAEAEVRRNGTVI